MENRLFDISGRIALVTGAGSGIGRTISETMAEFGAHVVCADIREDWAKETANLISKHGAKTLACKTDTSKQEEVKEMFARTFKEFGKLDILINNAGIATKSAMLHEMPLEDWKPGKVIKIYVSF